MVLLSSCENLISKPSPQPATYSVTYAGNGSTSGTVPADANNYQKDATVTTMDNTGTLAKNGNTFAGWNTKPDGTGTSYMAKVTFTMGPANATLCAVWIPLAAQKYAISGKIQKGPFSSGSSITIQALDANLDPQGTSYQTVTNDDFGAFSLGSQIRSRYVEIIAKGYCFNEIAGSLSASELTLRAITDLSPGTVANVNLLTTSAERNPVPRETPTPRGEIRHRLSALNVRGFPPHSSSELSVVLARTKEMAYDTN